MRNTKSADKIATNMAVYKKKWKIDNVIYFESEQRQQPQKLYAPISASTK